MRTSQIAIVAPPSELTSPNAAIPEIVYQRFASTATCTRSPTWKPAFFAVFWSITTWLGFAAHDPSTIFSGLKRE